MTEVEALLEVASAINNLAEILGWIGIVLMLFLLFKNMGGKS